MKSRILSMLAIVAVFCCGVAAAQVPHTLNYQGFLTSLSGAPVNNAGLQMVFNIYDLPSGGVALHTETQTVVVSNGIFNVLLGTSAALTLPFATQHYLGVRAVGDPEMSPRQALAASPYAIRAATAESADALATGGSPGQVLAGTGAAPAWTSVPTIAGNVVIGSTTTQTFPSRLQVVAPTTKTNATLGIRGLSVTSNEATAPFALDVKIFGAPLLANRGVILQSTDWNTADGGNLLLQPQGGNVGIGLGLYTPGSTLTVAGRIESTSGGVKFPDGTTQTTAATGGGTLAGDVTGPQAATVVALVGGVTATTVAAGVNLANAASSGNTLSALVRRDGSGNFSAGTISITGGVNLSATNAGGTQGVISQAGSRLLHSFGSNNFFAGTGAGNFSMTGGNNTATGWQALPANTSGSYNTASGLVAMQGNLTGGFNAAFGANALQALTGGSGNTAVGSGALSGVTGNSNIGIGSNAGGNLTTGSANIDIGNPGVAGESNIIRIGDFAHTKAFIAGIRSVTTGVNNALPVVIDSNGQLGTGALDFISQYQPGAVTVAPGAPISFSFFGPTSGFTVTSPATVTIPRAGVYRISFMFMESGDYVGGGLNPSPTLIQARINGVASPLGIFQFIPPAVGVDAPMRGDFIAQLNTGDALQIVNASATSFSYGAHPVNFSMATATLSVVRIQ